ncbi:MAG: hypothetical protein IPK70_00850 [Flavobacteriales bacterium]|jgi:hypothetical protein|nr:hypothetical protein [Flavobacteriales bacterium]
MSGMHPIDELFRRSLQGAAADPPNEVGAAILAHVRAKRRRALIWRRRLLAGLLLLIGSAASVAWVMRSSMRTDAPTEVVDVRKGPAAVEGALPTTSTGEYEPIERPGSEVSLRTMSPATALTTPSQKSQEPPTTPNRKSPKSTNPPSLIASVALGLSNSNSAGDGTGLLTPAIRIEDGRLSDERKETHRGRVNDRISRLQPILALSTPLPEKAWGVSPMHTVRSRGTWWIAITSSAQASRYQWQSDQANLLRALQGSGRWQGGVAIGALAGRAWPSGLSIGLGIEADRLDQTYRSLDQRTERQTETVTQVITLNTQVFASSVDTVTTDVVREAQAEGADRRVRVRIPLEAAWQLAAKRWRFGPRAGLVGEHTSIRSSASLAVDPSDRMVRARQLSASELRARYPWSLSAIAGIDLGFVLTDRSRIIATPFASMALTTFGGASDANARPERFGLRLMIQHRF